MPYFQTQCHDSRVIVSLVRGHFGELLRETGCTIHLPQEPLVIPPATLAPSSEVPLGGLETGFSRLLGPPYSRALQVQTPVSTAQGDTVRFNILLTQSQLRKTFTCLLKVVTLQIHSCKSQPQASRPPLGCLSHAQASSASSRLISHSLSHHESSSSPAAPDYSGSPAYFHPNMTGKGSFPFL